MASPSPGDIVVVGAGVIGCAVGYELARRGASVQILDDRPPGMGATQASAGVLAPFIEARDGGPLLELTARSLDLFDTFVARAIAESGLRVGYRRTGTLDAAFVDHSVQALAATRTLLAARGIEAEWLDSERARIEEPQLSEHILGALLIPSHGYVAASELTRALAAAARTHGAHIVEGGRVRRVAQAGRELRVETDRGTLSAHRVVVAAGSWAGQCEIDGTTSRVPVVPIRGQLLQLAWTGPLLGRVIWGERCYVVPWEDRTVLVGATVEDVGFDERTTVAGVRGLMDAACELLPQTSEATVTGLRAGLRPATPDHLPIIGASPSVPNVTYATGHYRNGILLAPLTAKLVADALIDERLDPLLALTSPQRFPGL